MLAFLLACGPSETAAPPAPPPAPAPVPAEEPVVGSIGGEPILPRPVVLGGLSTDAVVAAVEPRMADIRACARDAGRRGKVLVKIVIGKDGAVTSATTRSTTLRHPPTEDCVNTVVAEVKFPALAKGTTAIVQYPFELP